MFIALLIFTALSIAGSAAFFTMYGLAVTFSSGFWPVLVGGGSIEAGKLVMASYVYRYWNHIRWFFKPIYIFLILLAMFFTSIGVFGYLSAAYQKDVLPLDEINSKVLILEEKVSTFEKLKNEQMLQRQRLLDDKSKELAALPDNYATKKAEVTQRYQPLLAKINADIDTYNLQLRTLIDEKQDLKVTTIQQESKTGPIVFIAQSFGWDTDEAVKWLILLIVVIFDPMAVMLVVGINVTLVERMAHKRRRSDDRVHVLEDALETHEKASVPTIDEVETVIRAEVGDETTVEQIKGMIQELSNRELTPLEAQQKQMFEELLRRKTITEQVRNPKKDGETS